MSIATGALYPPRKPQVATIVRVRDGQVSRRTLTADGAGRLSLELDGDEYEVGISSGPVLALSGYRLDGAAWATAPGTLQIRVRFWNKGAAPSRPATLRWLSPNPGVELAPATSALPAIGPGQSAELPLSITVKDVSRALVKILAVQGDVKLPLDIRLFPPAAPFADFRIADGQPVRLYQHAVQKTVITLGDGNGDGRASPGERIAILIPEDDAYRAAELFTNDACVDNTLRAFDDWSDYDQVGASAKYSLPQPHAVLFRGGGTGRHPGDLNSRETHQVIRLVRQQHARQHVNHVPLRTVGLDQRQRVFGRSAHVIVVAPVIERAQSIVHAGIVGK